MRTDAQNLRRARPFMEPRLARRQGTVNIIFRFSPNGQSSPIRAGIPLPPRVQFARSQSYEARSTTSDHAFPASQFRPERGNRQRAGESNRSAVRKTFGSQEVAGLFRD